MSNTNYKSAPYFSSFAGHLLSIALTLAGCQAVENDNLGTQFDEHKLASNGENTEASTAHSEKETSAFQLTSGQASNIIGSFSTGDLNESFRGWNAKWFRTTDLAQIYELDGKVYRWQQQTNPRDRRFELDYPDLIQNGPGSSTTRQSISATLHAIYKYFGPRPTPPFARFNSLYLNGQSPQRLNEVWLETRRGWIYFMRKLDASGFRDSTQIYKWNGGSHANSSLIATIPNYRNGTSLLAYIALNPTPLPNIIISHNIMMGRQLNGKLRYTAHYYPVFENYVDYGGKLMQSRPRRLYGDWLDQVLFENESGNSEPFFSTSTYKPYILYFLDQNNRSHQLAAAPEPEIFHAYGDEQQIVSPKIQLFSRWFSPNPIARIEQIWLYGTRADERAILHVNSRTSTTTQFSMAAGNLKWTVALLSIEARANQTSAGTVDFSRYQFDSETKLNASMWQKFETAGWKTPIEKIYFGSAKCLSFKNVLLHHLWDSASRTERSRNPAQFRCFLVNVPNLNESKMTPITVVLRDGKRFSLPARKLQFVARNQASRSVVNVWSAPQTCEQACRYSGGKLNLTAQAEEAICSQQSHDFRGSLLNAGVRGCRFSHSALTGGYNYSFSYTYFGKSSQDTPSTGKLCFCRFESDFYDQTWGQTLPRPLGVQE